MDTWEESDTEDEAKESRLVLCAQKYDQVLLMLVSKLHSNTQNT